MSHTEFICSHDEYREKYVPLFGKIFRLSNILTYENTESLVMKFISNVMINVMHHLLDVDKSV